MRFLISVRYCPPSFVRAKGLYRLFLTRFGFAAIVNPFSKVCHVRADAYPPGPRLKAHELKHREQITREGAFKFTVKYLWYSLRHGYRNNPYEIEARKAEGEVI